MHFMSNLPQKRFSFHSQPRQKPHIHLACVGEFWVSFGFIVLKHNKWKWFCGWISLWNEIYWKFELCFWVFLLLRNYFVTITIYWLNERNFEIWKIKLLTYFGNLKNLIDFWHHFQNYERVRKVFKNIKDFTQVYFSTP